MTTANIIMNAMTSDIIEEAGEWTPTTGYTGTEAYEYMKMASLASALADADYQDDLKEVVRWRTANEVTRLNGTLTEDDVLGLKDFEVDMAFARPCDYLNRHMPYGLPYDAYRYIEPEDRI